MANGCPVLAAEAGALPEVCGAGALYFDPRDPQALADLLDLVSTQPALRDTVRARADRSLRKYTWRANAEIVADAIRQAIDPVAEAQFARG
jgi:glycosyltransferase involved in cell wall biosynthesis